MISCYYLWYPSLQTAHPTIKLLHSTPLSTQYEEVRHVIKSHAKVKTKQVVLRDSVLWINASVLDCRYKLRKAERIWRGGGYQDAHFQSYKLIVLEYSGELR